ncbi:D-alanyl-D-alanine carboxypeptidase family protein [Gemmiger sp. An50]|uniref:D-alanyl-D-alanine carboxypeptidase family protein n=1 Tax=Gemmiger sp. An50 TaxID=1965639 RepID=UPI000B38294D|nr:D-alanyl-D-alanine carboxypeptidase family protein [Gemmiger sp. An50]OUN87824.1 D-alanyl-D-alanine carboxypeptidase [Gemmiger sp. An50]
MAKRRAAALVLTAALLVGLALPAHAQDVQAGRFALGQFDVPCRAAILIDQESGTVLYEKEADTQMPIASITKVMTLLLVMEGLEEGRFTLEDTVPVTEHAYSMGGSQIWLEPGEEFTVDEMLRAVCVASANDAAVALAEMVGGSEPVFVEQMNQKAAQLGMSNTTFQNACGLDQERHLSTARDVAIMSREILNNHPQILNYTGIWTDSLRGGQTQLVNTNKLLRRYQGITGLKTGTTGGARVCLSASATRDGLSLIAVVLGASSSTERFDAATALLDYGFANFTRAQAPAPENAPGSLPVTGGALEEVPLQYQTPGTVLLQKGEEQSLQAELKLNESAQAPVTVGDEVGRVVLYAGQTELGSWPVTAAAEVPAMSWKLAMERLWQGLLAH